MSRQPSIQGCMIHQLWGENMSISMSTDMRNVVQSGDTVDYLYFSNQDYADRSNENRLVDNVLLVD